MTIRITGMNSGLDTDSIITELVSAYKAKGDKYVKEQTKLSWTQDLWKSLNTKIFNFYKSLDKLRLGSSVKKKTTVSDPTKAKITAGSGAVSGTQTLQVKELAKGKYITGDVLEKTPGEKVTSNDTLSNLGYSGSETIKIEGSEGSVDIAVDGTTTISDFVKKINESGVGVKASFDETNQRIFISSTKTGVENSFTMKGTGDALDKLGLKDEKEGGKAVVKDATDAKIILNGAEYTSSNNTFNVNGLTIQATAKTADNEELTITTDTDTQGMYDNIKEFISSYNDLINELSSYYNADSAKGYEPLTADEKDAMSESDIAEWEKKIKGSLLRRDSTLSGIMSAMTSAMSSTVTVNGKSFGLANLGIKTLGYFASSKNEKNAFHIDGDEDDTFSSENEDKLMAMLNSDPEAVNEIIKGIASKLYNNMDEKLKGSSTLKSAYTVYNDKEMAKSYSDYTTKIKEWNEKVEKIEDSYYKKFSAMEVALGKLQNQMSAFTGMLG